LLVFILSFNNGDELGFLWRPIFNRFIFLAIGLFLSIPQEGMREMFKKFYRKYDHFFDKL